MWKIYIADDEPKIRDGLKTMVQSMGHEVCGEARNGLRALEEILRLRPDIALVDINMPRLNGLELIGRLTEAGLDCKVIIISGYDEFEYAQKSIRMGVCAYLLKPVLEAELREAITGAVRELEYRRSSNRYIQMARKQLAAHMPYLRECFLQEWFGGSLSGQEVLEQMELFDVRFPDSAMLLIACPAGRSQAQPSAMAEYIAQYTLKNIMEESLRNLSEAVVFSNGTGCIVALFPAPEDGAGALTEQVERLAVQSLDAKPLLVCKPCVLETAEDVYSELLESLREMSVCRPVVMEARQYLYEHYMEPDLDLTRVAEMVGINASYLSRLMKSELGVSFKDFLSHLRIRRATELMRDPALSLNEIAGRVGYVTQHYFSTAFKNALNVSPSEYRKGIQN